jgi:uncharacterized protein
MPLGDFVQRLSAEGLVEAIGDSPVVLLHGPRQSGKTTLARHVGNRLGYTYLTFDDVVASQAANADPVGFGDGLFAVPIRSMWEPTA